MTPTLKVSGIENLTSASKVQVLYIPKMESVLASIRDRHIREEFDGTNGHKLAIRYNVSDSWVLRVVNEKQLFGQMNMFD